MKTNDDFKDKLITTYEKQSGPRSDVTLPAKALIAKQFKRCQSTQRAAVCSWFVTCIFYVCWRLLVLTQRSDSFLASYLYNYDQTLKAIAQLLHSGFLWETWLVISGLLTFYAYRQSRRLTMQQILYRLSAIEEKLASCSRE